VASVDASPLNESPMMISASVDASALRTVRVCSLSRMMIFTLLSPLHRPTASPRVEGEFAVQLCVAKLRPRPAPLRRQGLHDLGKAARTQCIRPAAGTLATDEGDVEAGDVARQ
jgi:hypothetical protein